MRRVPPVLALLFALAALAAAAHAQHPPHGAHRRARHVAHVSPRYARMRARWHRAASRDDVRHWEDGGARPPLVLRPIAEGESVTLSPERDDGGFGGDALPLARTAMRDRRGGAEHDVHPALLDRVYHAVRHFHAPWAWVVSGFRANAGTSRHALGRAVDVVLPGVRDETLAAFFRAEGFAGVGTYPLSGFVHVDVRDRSYFWVDRSAPGAPNHTRAVRDRDARRSDLLARRRGLLPPIGAAEAAPEDETIDEATDAEQPAPDEEAGPSGEAASP